MMTMTEEELRARFPLCINEQRLPLKLGIHSDMGLNYPDPALELWCSHCQYLRNALMPGAQRINLDGSVVAPVTESERKYHWNRLMWVRHDLAGLQHRRTKEENRELNRAMPKKSGPDGFWEDE